MSALQKIEEVHGKLSDTNIVWFPFLFLKLKPHQWLSYPHLLKMTFCFGSYFGVVLHLKNFISGQVFDLEAFTLSLAQGWGLFFVWFNLVTRWLWNRRVKRLRAKAA